MATRAELRREIAVRTGQPFFRRYGKSAGTASVNGTTTTLIDTTRLLEKDDYWNGHFIYFPDTDELREITDFTTSTLTWLAPVAAGTTDQGEPYELWSRFTPIEAHAAIDNALREAWPHFFEQTYDESLVIRDEYGLFYNLPVVMRRLCQVYLMYNDSDYTGTVTTLGTNVQVIDSRANFDSEDVGQWIVAYTGLGEVRQIAAVDSSTQVTVSQAFSAALPVGSKFKKLNKQSETNGQLLLHNWNVDKTTYPTQLWLSTHVHGHEGYLLRLVYETEYSLLENETSETTCPTEYLIHKALSYLYQIKLNTSDVQNQPVFEALWKVEEERVKEFIIKNRFRHLPGSVVDHGLQKIGLPAGYPFKRS